MQLGGESASAIVQDLVRVGSHWAIAAIYSAYSLRSAMILVHPLSAAVRAHVPAQQRAGRRPFQVRPGDKARCNVRLIGLARSHAVRACTMRMRAVGMGPSGRVDSRVVAWQVGRGLRVDFHENCEPNSEVKRRLP